jgi:LuxR family transcriptional regulator, maltose regulon positive regulatory protein
MSDSAAPHAPPRTGIPEAELAASTLALLAKPALWPSLRIGKCSPAAAAKAPWSAYWSARLDANLDATAARELLAAAAQAFEDQREPTGALLCAAAVIETFYVEEGALDPMDAWIERLARLLPADGAWSTPELEAQVMACGIGIVLRDQTHPLLGRWAERGAVLVRQLAPGAVRVKLATFLLQYHLWRGEFGKTGMIVDALPGLDLAGLLPAEALVWHQSVATHARFTAQHERGLQAIDAALALAQTHGLSQHLYALHAHGASLAVAAHDADKAQFHLDAMRPVLDTLPQADQTHYWHFHTGLCLLRGDAPRAVEHARMTLGNSAEIGGSYRTVAHRFSLGQALLAQGDAAAALDAFSQTVREAREISAGLIAFSATLMSAACLRRLGRDAEGDVALRDAAAEGAQQDYLTIAGWWMPEIVAPLAQRALDAAIEPAWVRRMVRHRALPAPASSSSAWPWVMCLRGFGELQVTLNDVPLAAGAKASQRPLDLLRALLAHGPTPLPVATALQWLWPEADSAAQRKAFDVALLRLRRMLADERLLRLDGGRLSLASDWVWTDVGALHALMQSIGSAAGAETAQLQHWGAQLMDLMRGPFLGTDDTGWVQAARERYRQRFVVTVSQLAAQMEERDPSSALRLYERALDIDPMAESLARRLMRLHVRRGDPAQALRVLRMCSAMLSLSTGLPVSPETRACATELGLPTP